MYFRILHDQVNGFASYLLGDTTHREAVLIDPCIADIAVTRAILNDQQLRLTSILFTHEHDQTRAMNESVLSAFNTLCVDYEKLALTPGTDLLTFGNERLHIMKTPGHTLTCQSFLWRDRLFCGDLLTVDSCPHQPRPISAGDLWNSVTQKIFMLPAEIFLFSGHAKQARFLSTVLEQRLWHPWFSGTTRDTFLARVTAPLTTTALISMK